MNTSVKTNFTFKLFVFFRFVLPDFQANSQHVSHRLSDGQPLGRGLVEIGGHSKTNRPQLEGAHRSRVHGLDRTLRYANLARTKCHRSDKQTNRQKTNRQKTNKQTEKQTPRQIFKTLYSFSTGLNEPHSSGGTSPKSFKKRKFEEVGLKHARTRLQEKLLYNIN